MRRKKVPIFLDVTIGIILLGGPVIAGQPPENLKCRGQQISEAVFEDNLDAALTMTQICIEANRAELKTREKEQGDVRLVAATSGAFLCAKLEILAMKGALAEAESAHADAEKFDQRYPDSALNWHMIGAPLPTAKAFLLEKKGDLNAAAAAYEAILDQAKKDGWSNNSHVINGRLAVIALLKGDVAVARRRSENALAFDPGANAVLGSLLKKSGDTKGAKAHFEAALKLMSDARKGENWRLPIYFAEHKRAQDGLDK
jgi:predicted negative regulator of RcsB-dependent stress response